MVGLKKRAILHMALLLGCFALVVLMLRLGFWQIDRAHQKESMRKAMLSQAALPVKYMSYLEHPEPYQNVELEGQYLPNRIFLDNQFWQHRFGYHVLTAFLTTKGQLLLVDRGWIQGDPTRQTLPQVEIPQGRQRLKGQIWYPGLRNWSIGPQLEEKPHEQLIIEQANPALVQAYFSKPLLPFLIRLDADNASGFVREWAETKFRPERHYAYAFQWFAMAGTLLILVVVFLYRRHHATK